MSLIQFKDWKTKIIMKYSPAIDLTEKTLGENEQWKYVVKTGIDFTLFYLTQHCNLPVYEEVQL